MQCPKCGHDAADSSSIEAGKCPSCDVYYHKVLRPEAPLPDRQEPPIERGRAKLLLKLAFAALVLVVISAYWGYGAYQRHALVEQVEASMRMANSYIAEILDDSAKLTNGEYLQKVPGRIEQLDSLVASTLSIDDASIPGLADAAADYAKASRSFLNRFTDNLKMDLRLSVVEASYRAHDGYASSVEGLEYLGKTDEQVNTETGAALEAVKSTDDLIESVRLFKVAADKTNKQQRRSAYLKSVAELNEAKAQSAQTLRALDEAGRHLQKVGDKVSSLADKPMPTKAWEIPRT